MYSNFQWPVSPYYEAATAGRIDQHEPAILHFLDGRKLEGLLTRFLPSHGVVEFVPKKEQANIDVQLTDIEQLRLNRPVVPRPRKETGDIEQPGQIARPSERQTFRVEFVNGNVLAAETIGFEMQESGLFLFVVDGNDAVIRTFIPASSIKTEQIGPLIGETLIEQKILPNSEITNAPEGRKQPGEQSLGELLAEHKVISEEQLHAALARARARTVPVIKLGWALIELNMITRKQLDVALELQRTAVKKPLGAIMLDLGYISRDQLSHVRFQMLGIPSVELAQFDIDPSVLKLLPDELVRKFHVIPVCYDGAALVVAMPNPLDAEPVERVRFYARVHVIPVKATIEDIDQAIRAYYGIATSGQGVEEIAEQLSAEMDLEAVSEEAINETDNTLVRLVNKMILDAHTAGASDIHVEASPGKTGLVIRFRKDGVLSEYLRLPHNFRSATVSRLKIMADLDISEHRRSQDGRINFQKFGPAKVELRVVTVPTQDGLEDVVMRLLAMTEPLSITKLGLREPVQNAVKKLLEKPHGLILVVGPTGSGKTTTLHSLLNVLNMPGMKIWTAENPVEITQPGVRQVQVNSKIGWDFATVMRTFMRADPNIIMVGEMRDQETARVAVEASLTGHLVFSTLHTNSAPETVVRLLEIGIDPFSFTDSLLGVLAQRLARRLCVKCRTNRLATGQEIRALAEEYCYETEIKPADVIEEWKRDFGGSLMIHEARGCGECGKTGYRGRIGLHELLVATPGIRQMMLQHAAASELRAAGIRGGMRTLKQDGIEKCLAGYTDIHQVRAVAT